MVRSVNDNKVNKSGSILLVLMIGFLSLLLQHTVDSGSNTRDKSAPAEISFIKSTASLPSGIQSCHFIKAWIPNRDNFRLLSFDKSQFRESKYTDRRILISEAEAVNSAKSQFFFYHRRQFTDSCDDIPDLS